jgi:hypothetical protein
MNYKHNMSNIVNRHVIPLVKITVGSAILAGEIWFLHHDFTGSYKEDLDHFKTAHAVELLDLNDDSRQDYIITCKDDSIYVLIDDGRHFQAIDNAGLQRMPYAQGRTIEDCLKERGKELH